MAESVHHLVGGSPLRSGLAADVIGKAAAPPDPLSAISTPTSAVSVTHTLALAICAPTASPWPNSPRASLDPASEAVAQWSFGQPGDWLATITPTGAPSPQTVTLTELGMCALDFAVELTTPIDTSPFAARVRAHSNAAPDALVTVTRADGHGGTDAAARLAATVRTVLSRCRSMPGVAAALTPGADIAATGDIDELSARITSWWTSVQQVLTGWTPTDTASAVSVLNQLSRLGLAGARTDAPASTLADLFQRWAGLLALPTSTGAATKSLITPPPPPAPGATAPTAGQAADWLAGVATALRKATGDWLTPAPTDKSLSASWTALPGSIPTTGGNDDAVADWIRQHAAVCPGVAAVSDLLALTGACGSAQPPDWLLRQQPGDSSATGTWIGTAHPGNRSATALTCLRIGADTPDANRVLLVVDQWTETVPIAPRQPETGTAPAVPHQEAALALRYDSPDSRPPQALLLVTPPDPTRGWCAEDLYTAVEETLWWSMARPIDVLDNPEQKATY
jgi:hypothetical protein